WAWLMRETSTQRRASKDECNFMALTLRGNLLERRKNPNPTYPLTQVKGYLLTDLRYFFIKVLLTSAGHAWSSAGGSPIKCVTFCEIRSLCNLAMVEKMEDV